MQVVAPPTPCVLNLIYFLYRTDMYLVTCMALVVWWWGEGGERVGAGGGRAGCACAHWSGELLIHIEKDG